MASTQADVDDVLTTLEDLLGEVTGLRQRYAAARDGFESVQADYRRELGPLYERADLLRAQRVPKPILPPPPPLPPDKDQAGVTAPRPVEEGPARPLDSRARRKGVLKDHIDFFREDGPGIAIEMISALIVDPRSDVGDILEVLAWGAIWKARPDWETLDDQLARLEGWRDALQERASYWRRQVASLAGDEWYSRWQLREQDPARWRSFLDERVREQQEEIERLTRELQRPSTRRGGE